VETPSENFLNVLHLDLTCLDDGQLKTSLFSRMSMHDDTVRTVETQQIALERITQHSQQMVSMLNQANRNGRVSSTVLEKLKETGQFLRDELFSPSLKARLNTSNADHMTILVDERLVHIPWEMLYDGQQFLCQRFALGRLVQTQHTVHDVHQQPRKGPIRFMILADLDGSLPAARREGADVRDFIESVTGDTRVMMRTANVDVDFVRTKIRNYDWVHFAGHVDYGGDVNPAGGWRLSDGLFSTEDVAKMAGTGGMPTLLFANGCQSARTSAWSVDPARQHAFFGLVNAFLLSGTRHYVGTSWEIPDEPGRCFALSFYRHLMAGATVGSAVAHARNHLIETYGEAQIVWASYVLYGDPTHRYIDGEVSSRFSKRTHGHYNRSREVPLRAGEHQPPQTEHTPYRGHRAGSMIIACFLIAAVLVFAMTHSFFLSGNENQRLHQAKIAFDAGNLEAVLDICPPPSSEAAFLCGCVLLRGNALLVQGRLDEAASAYTAVSDATNAATMESAEAWMGLGRIASMCGEQDRAMACYQRAADVAPQRSKPLLALGMLKAGAGRDVEAMDYLKAAKRMEPEGDIAIDAMIRSITEKKSLSADTARMARIDRLIDELQLARQHSPAQVPVDSDKSGPLCLWIMDMQSSGYSLREGAPQLMTVMIENCLQGHSAIRVIDRHLMDKTLAELKLGSSVLVEQQMRLQLGRLQAVRMMVSGRMIFSSAETQVTLRCIDIQTSRVEAIVVMTFENQLPVSEMARKVTDQLIEKIHPVTVKMSCRSAHTAFRCLACLIRDRPPCGSMTVIPPVPTSGMGSETMHQF